MAVVAAALGMRMLAAGLPIGGARWDLTLRRVSVAGFAFQDAELTSE